MSLDAPCYRKTMLSKIATKLSTTAKEAMVNRFFDAFPPAESSSFLDLGVTSERDSMANFLEKRFPFPG